MTAAAKQVFESALALPEEERAALVDALNDSLEGRDPGLSPEWSEELGRRIAAVERGESRLIPGADVSARAREILRAR
ncbi:addiction module protein [Paraliomyxa miuraensis]|uniref:addiction module protein n=1 Tax=Paraliomyxa miuraensis TaxID=376150 RepID=UPI002252B60C|nr:addiction module protein [Paraliomyxa miuraensis]MCX4244170.1 addiction module protein [Paraliomyxa miuraensis]